MSSPKQPKPEYSIPYMQDGTINSGKVWIDGPIHTPTRNSRIYYISTGTLTAGYKVDTITIPFKIPYGYKHSGQLYGTYTYESLSGSDNQFDQPTIFAKPVGNTAVLLEKDIEHFNGIAASSSQPRPLHLPILIPNGTNELLIPKEFSRNIVPELLPNPTISNLTIRFGENVKYFNGNAFNNLNIDKTTFKGDNIEEFPSRYTSIEQKAEQCFNKFKKAPRLPAPAKLNTLHTKSKGANSSDSGSFETLSMPKGKSGCYGDGCCGCEIL